MDSVQRRAFDSQRCASVAAQAFDIGTHHGKRLYDPLHRTLLYGGIASKRRGERLGGKNAGNQPGSSSAVPSIQNAGRGGQAVQPFAADRNRMIPAVDLNAEAAETINGGQAVCSLEKIGNFCFPFGQGAEHDGAVGDGFIARDGNFPFQSFGMMEFHDNLRFIF